MSETTVPPPPSAPVPGLDDSAQWPYVAAAAVLTTFHPDTLMPLPGATVDEDALAEMLLDHAEPIKAGPSRGRWRLRDDVRYRALATLRTRERILDALRAHTIDRADDPAAAALTDLVTPTSAQLPPPGAAIGTLIAFDMALQWLKVTAITPPITRDAIRVRIEREKRLEPFRRLCVGFQGRDDDLTALRAYVDTLPSATYGEAIGRFGQRLLNEVFQANPPFVLWGPGGAGKSTLIGRFILNHADVDVRPMAFVLLDFDRVTLDPTRPDTLLTDVIAQLTVQAPELASRLVDLQQGVASRLGSEDQYRPERSSHRSDSDTLRAELCEVLRDIAKATGQPVLFVVDTFEVVQRRGPTAVYAVLDLVVTLLAAVRSLRVVMIGRSELRRQDFTFSEDVPKLRTHRLAGFDASGGRAYLRQRLHTAGIDGVSDTDLDHIVLLVRGNPLGLRLAATVYVRQGMRGIDEAAGRQKIQEAIAEEQIQGMLHQRIVEQLDGDVQKIANPGLIVRRLTTDVIREVLAVPCDLDLEKTSAEQLFESLSREASLFEDVDGVTLRHRPDVRLIMLPSLRRELGAKAAAIDEAAVTYWYKQPGPAALAEEIYHRLWRGDSEDVLNTRWSSEAAFALEDAADEFLTVAPSDEARVWLAGKLDRELSTEIRANASQPAWERDISLKANRLLADGKTEDVLRLLNERPRQSRTPSSALWLLEADTLLVMGRNDAARAVLLEATARSYEWNAPPTYTAELIARQAALDEREGKLDEAYEKSLRALELSRASGLAVQTFAAGVTVCRIARKRGIDGDASIQALVSELVALLRDESVGEALKNHSTLLREATAELGTRAPALVADALVRLGVETLRVDDAWWKRIPPDVTSILGDYGVEVSAGRGGTRETLQKTAESLAKMLRNENVATAAVEALTKLFTYSVDRFM